MLVRILLTIILLATAASQGWAAIAYVNGSVFNGSGSNVSTMATAALNVTTGNLIVVTVSMNVSNDTVTSVNDTAGNTYHQATGCYIGGNGGSDIWYAYNVTGNASNVVTVVIGSAGNYGAVTQLQYSGAGTTSAVFQTCGNGSTTSGTATSSSFNPSIANGVNVVNEYVQGSTTITQNGGYTARNTGWATADLYPASSGAQTASYNTSPSGNNAFINVASFAPAGGSSSTNVTINKATVNIATIN